MAAAPEMPMTRRGARHGGGGPDRGPSNALSRPDRKPHSRLVRTGCSRLTLKSPGVCALMIAMTHPRRPLGPNASECWRETRASRD